MQTRRSPGYMSRFCVCVSSGDEVIAEGQTIQNSTPGRGLESISPRRKHLHLRAKRHMDSGPGPGLSSAQRCTCIRVVRLECCLMQRLAKTRKQQSRASERAWNLVWVRMQAGAPVVLSALDMRIKGSLPGLLQTFLTVVLFSVAFWKA